MPDSPEPPNCFISYSWDNPKHKSWVEVLAKGLTGNGVYVVFDQWDTEFGDDLPQYMEKSVRESDFVLMVCTPNYALKANSGKGGAVYAIVNCHPPS